ncbi:MAG TPA: lyase family protein [Polyangiaceae bacterium]
MALPTFDPGFTTARMTDVFSGPRRIATMLGVERALAAAQATAGLVPEDAAAAIARVCASFDGDAEALLGAGWEAGTVVVPLLDALRAALEPEDARWLHFGATTQDVVDTASMLQARDGLEAVAPDLDRIASRCRTLATFHRATGAQGRTFLQSAVPTTFGHRAAGWWVAVDRAAQRLAAIRAALPLQLGGPVGHLAAFGAAADAVRAEMARSLGLAAPVLAWHADRQPVRDVVSALAEAANAAAKIALDVALLAQPEIAEVKVRAGGSSSMPHKANPVDAMRALAAAEACGGVAGVVTRGAPQALERGLGAWHAEAFAVPLVFHTAAAALEAIRRCLEGLEPDPARMAAHLRGGSPADLEAIAVEVDRVLRSKR